jgi:hypothetical protein
MALDAAQEARLAEINASLRQSGKASVSGPQRRALMDELIGLLGTGERPPVPLAPEQQARVDAISTRLMDQAMGKPGAFIGAIERDALVKETTDILLGADAASGGQDENGRGDGA